MAKYINPIDIVRLIRCYQRAGIKIIAARISKSSWNPIFYLEDIEKSGQVIVIGQNQGFLGIGTASLESKIIGEAAFKNKRILLEDNFVDYDSWDDGESVWIIKGRNQEINVLWEVLCSNSECDKIIERIFKYV